MINYRFYSVVLEEIIELIAQKKLPSFRNYRHSFVVLENTFRGFLNNIFDHYLNRCLSAIMTEKKFVVDHRQKYVEIAENCFGIDCDFCKQNIV